MTQQKQTMKIEWIEVDKLNPAVYNPRKDLQPDDPEYTKIQKSINEFGLVEPLVINKDMTVIGGHQRLKILIEAGFKTVPCSVVDIPKENEPILNIALNNPPGKWDYPKLKDLIVEIDAGDFDIELTGFDEIELKDIFDYEKEVVNTEKEVDENIKEIKNNLAHGILFLIGYFHMLITPDMSEYSILQKVGGQHKKLNDSLKKRLLEILVDGIERIT